MVRKPATRNTAAAHANPRCHGVKAKRPTSPLIIGPSNLVALLGAGCTSTDEYESQLHATGTITYKNKCPRCQSKSDTSSDFIGLVLFGNTRLCAIGRARDTAAHCGCLFPL